MLRFKPEVEPSGCANEVWFAIGVAHGLRPDVVVTSMRDGHHNQGSLHYHGLAVDFRVIGMTPAERDLFVAGMKAKLGPLGFDVVLENVGSNPAANALHLHVEWDGKPGEKFIVRA